MTDMIHILCIPKKNLYEHEIILQLKTLVETLKEVKWEAMNLFSFKEGITEDRLSVLIQSEGWLPDKV